MDFVLELVMIPVTDAGRAKEFYLERAGFWRGAATRRRGPWAADRRLTAVTHRNTDEFSLRHSFYLQDAVERGY
jgi:hypothetical protein